MKCSSSELVGLFQKIGKPKANEWTKKLLEAKIPSIPQLASENQDKVNKLDEKNSALLEKLMAALKDEEKIELEFDHTPDEKKKEEGKKKVKEEKSKKKVSSDKKGDKVKVVKKEKPVKDKKEEKSKKKSSSAGNGIKGEKPGIISTMIEYLKTSASKEKPATRDDVVKHLKKQFPKRPVEGMRVTVVSQLPTRLIKRGENVKSNDEGYWISKNPKKEKAK